MDPFQPDDNSEEIDIDAIQKELEDAGLAGIFRLIILGAVMALVGLVVSISFWLWVSSSDNPLAFAVRDWLIAFWPLLLCLMIPSLAQNMASTAFVELQKILDHKYPDDMDVHTGHWLERRLKDKGLEHDVVVGGTAEMLFRSANAYDPKRDIVFLGDLTFHKKDPTFWAIAAHELGHAIVHRKHRIWGVLNMWLRRLYRPLIAAMPTWLILSTLYASELTADLTFALLAALVAVGSLVCVDEALASWIALREMRDDERVHQETVKDIRNLLAAAWSTYAAQFTVYAVFIAAWGPLKQLLVSGEYLPLAANTENQALLTEVLSIALMIMIGISIVRTLIRKPMDVQEVTEMQTSELATLVSYAVAYSVVVTLFIVLVWNRSADPVFLAAMFLAAPKLTAARSVLAVPFGILSTILTSMLKRLIGAPQTPPEDGPKLDKTDEMARFKLLDPQQNRVLNQGMSIWSNITPIPLIVVCWML